MSEIIKPFTDEQVDSLNYWQSCGYVHPFTCGNSDCRGSHPNAALVATPDGWICQHCNYTQNWAHEFMTKEHVNPLAGFTKGTT